MDIIFMILGEALRLYTYAILVYILLTWVPGSLETPIGRFFERICEPYLSQFRRFIPPVGMFDFSPIIALLVLHFAGAGLSTLAQMF